MKKLLSFGLIMFALLFSLNARAESCTRDMLKQVGDVNSSWKPVVGTSLYSLKLKDSTILIMLFYNQNRTYTNDGSVGMTEPDPEKDDVRVVFQKKGNRCTMLFIDFYASVDLIKSNINLLIPNALDNSK